MKFYIIFKKIFSFCTSLFSHKSTQHFNERTEERIKFRE
uniref:Uncharacterized protein n=1 Tax=Anguilla anguilla TaxID=7936 RepID=A0A0E9SXD0_ANGAN